MAGPKIWECMRRGGGPISKFTRYRAKRPKKGQNEVQIVIPRCFRVCKRDLIRVKRAHFQIFRPKPWNNDILKFPILGILKIPKLKFPKLGKIGPKMASRFSRILIFLKDFLYQICVFVTTPKVPPLGYVKDSRVILIFCIKTCCATLEPLSEHFFCPKRWKKCQFRGYFRDFSAQIFPISVYKLLLYDISVYRSIIYLSYISHI